eukprot:7975208-Karenia_brevis.AAC.1
MTRVDCSWLRWIEFNENHVWESVQSSWESQESEGELRGNFQGTNLKGPQTCFGCHRLTSTVNDSHALPMPDEELPMAHVNCQ